jgi:hypothetical protein
MRIFLILILTYILGFLTCSLSYEIDKRKTYPEEIFLAEKGNLLIVTSTNPLRLGFYHKCKDTTHNSCDGKCSCDGLDCK